MYHKVWKTFACFFIIMLMVLSMMPNNMLFAEPNSDIEHTTETTDEPQEVQQEEQEPEKELRGAQDLSKQTELLNWQIDSILVKGNEEKPAMIKSKDDTMDLSKTDAETIKELQLLFILQISEVTDEHYLQKGDTLSITLPKEFVIDEVKEPVAIFTYDQKVYEENGLREEDKKIQIGEYTLDKEHILHITFTQAITKEDMSEVFAILPITFSLPKDQKDLTTITFPLQEENKNLSILLPVQKTEEVKKEEPKEEQPKEEPKTEPTKDEPVSDDKTEANTQPKEETVEKTDKEKPTENVKDEVKKDGNLKPNTTIRQALISTVRIFPSNVQDKILQTLASTSPYKQTFVTDLPDGFESVKISVINKNGGYTNANKTDPVGFKFELALNDEYLITELERVLATMPDAPVFNGNSVDYDKAVIEFLEREDVKQELSALEYTFDLGDSFHNFNSNEHENLKENGSEENIGKYWIENGIVHVLFSPTMYYYSDVSAGFSFDAQLDDDAELSDKPQDLEFENGKLVLKQIGSIDGGDDPADVVKYSVDKDAPLSVDEPEINYTIDVKAKTTDVNLDGKYFSDKIPAGLQVKHFYFIDSDGNETEITSNEYKVEDGELLYQISGKGVKEISFHLILEADDKTYQNLIKAGSMNQLFTNTASLKDSDNKTELAVSDEVSTNMKVTFLKKEGKQQDLEGTKFNWTIQADTKLPLFDKGYLIDTFAYSDHMLAEGTSLTITFDGTIKSFDINEIKKIESNTPYTDLTVENISQMSGNSTEPFYYIYETETDSKFDDESKVKQCVLIIPFDNYHDKNSSKKVKIQYITELNLHGLTIDEYLQDHSDNAKGIGNIVNLIWTNKGEGPGPAVWDDVVNFSKDVDTNVDVMDKKGVYYDPVTQQTYWNLEVNRMGAVVNPLNDAKDITIIDTFNKGAYELSSLKITYTKYNRDKGKSENVNLDTEKTKNEYYEIGNNGNDSQIIIHMPQLGVNDYRIYHIQAKLKDANSLNQQGKISISNKAKINANVNDKPVQTEIEAKMNIDNTLIIKDADGGYDYNQHLFTWKVTVNPNKLDITDAKVVDTLEAKTSFKELKSVEVENIDGTKENINLTNIKHEGQKTTFTLDNISGKTYTLRFTTHLDDTQVLSQLKDTSKVFHNNVELTGTVHGDEGVTQAISNATDAANVVLKNNQIEKGGVYNPEDGSIAWTIYVNKDQVNLKGLTFVENLREGFENEKPSIQELDQDSIKIFKIGMNSDGSVNTTNEEDVTDQMNVEINGYDGFKCKITNDDSNTYKVTFTTYLNENAENTTISNEVYMQDDSGNKSENSNVSDGGYDGSFNFDDMATKNPRPKVAIRKVSSNSIDTGENRNYLLDKAEFKITAYELNTDNTLGKEITTYNKINVSVNGTAYFLNIMNKENIVYKLEETKAPLGYNKYKEPVFMRFTKDTSASPLTIQYESKPYLVKNITYGANIDVSEIIIEDEPTANAKFTFVKQVPSKVENGEVKEFTNAKAGIKFLLHPNEKLINNVKDRIVETNSNGEVTIDKIDPGTYTLTEILSDTNLDVGGSFTLVAAVNEDGTYLFDLTGNSNHGLSYKKDTSTNQYILKNDYVRGTLTFKKYVQYQDGKEADHNIVKDNQEPLAGVEFTLTANDATNTNIVYTKTATSGDDGIVTFANIPVGEYTLKETNKDGYDGYVENTNSYIVKVMEEIDTSKELYKENNTLYYGKKAKIEISPKLNSSDDTILFNTPEKGNLILQKSIDINNTGLANLDKKPLKDVEFGLYRNIGGKNADTNTAEKPIYTAKSEEDGKIIFNNVEYGDYVCKEISTLSNFENMKKNEEILITRADFHVETDNGTHILKLKNDIVINNRLANKSITLYKEDQDGNKLSNVNFNLYRRSISAINEETDDINLLNPDDTITTYYPYMKNYLNKSDDNGKIALANLPVGDYLLIEDSTNQNLQDGHDHVAAYINITKDSVNIKYTDRYDNAIVFDSSNKNYMFDKNFDKLDNDNTKIWSDLASDKDENYTIKNQRKYANIQINKIAGELQNNLYKNEMYNKPVQGAKFLISTVDHVDNNDVLKPYIYLNTNADGHFDITHDGKMKGFISDEKDANETAKRLYYGDYAIQEISTVSGYVQPVEDIVYFSINPETTTLSHGGTAWLTNQATKGSNKGSLIIDGTDKEKSVFINPLVRSEVLLTKLGDGEQPLTNAEFTIKDGNTVVAYLTYREGKDGGIGNYVLTNSNGNQTLDEKKGNIPYLYKDGDVYKLLSGTYQVEESKTPNGYTTADPIEFTLNDKGEIIIDNKVVKDNIIVMKDELIKGQIKIHKKNGSGEDLSDVVFDLYKKDGTKIAENLVTNDKGIWESASSDIERLDNKAKLSDGLEIGEYYFQEIKTQDGYQLPEPNKAKTEFEITGKIDDNNIVTQPDILTKEVENGLYIRTLEIIKKDGVDSSSISGATFTLQRIKDSAGNNVDETIYKKTTDDKGNVAFTLTNKGTYVLKETKPAIGYVLGEKAYEKEFTIDDATSEQILLSDNSNIILNERATGTVKLLKTDSTGEKKLNHAEFKLYKDGKELGTFVTGKAYTKDSDKWNDQSNDDGYLQISGLEWGKYELVESKAPDGYKLDTTAHTFTINQQGFEKEFVDAGTIKNVTTKFTLKKTDLSGNSITGAKFTISDVTDNSKTKALQEKLDKMESEITLSGLLIAGHTYELTETKAPDGYQRATATITFTMQANGEIDMNKVDAYNLTNDKTVIIVKNAPITASIVKQNDEKQPQSGVEFTIKPAEGSKFLKTPEQQLLITNDNGEIVLDGYLLQGNTYIVHEEKALNGYSYEEDRTLTVDENGIVSWSVNGKEMDNVFTDHALKFDIVKVDDAGNKIKGKLFKLTDSDGKEWAVISNAEGVLIDQNSGQPLAKELAAGKSYTLEESKMENSPYINLHSAITFDITRQGTLDNVEYHKSDNVALSKDSLHLQITNVQTTANFKKVNAKGEVVVGAKLAIYADTNGEAGNKVLYSWTTDKDIHTIKMLPQGTYWLKEVETPYGYITANPIQFTMDGKGELSINNKEGSVENQTIIMTDELVKGHVKIEKQSDQGVALSDVVFDLYHADGKLIAQNLTTDKDGNWYSEGSKELSAGLEAGKYYIQETKTQDGYQLPENNKTFFTIVGKDTAGIITQPDVISVEVKNQPYQRTLHIVKKDIEDDAVIPNTMFTLQRIKDGNGKEVTEDVMTKVTGEDGTLSFTMDQKGTYRLSETTPANGYVLGKTPYVKEFVLDDTSAASITLEEGNTIYNERATGVMQLVKTDDLSKEALNGAVFTLYQGDKKLGDFTTGNNYTKDASGKWNAESGEEGNLKISGLSWGDYIIKETKAADGYQLENNEASFTIGKSGTDMILEVSDIAITNLRTKFTFKKRATYVESCSDETLGTGALPGNSTKILQGAEFSAYDETGKLFASAISDEFGNVTFEKMLANHTYTIKETKVPTGYIDHKSVYQVHIDENGQCGELIDTSTNKAVKEVINDLQRTDIVLKKVSETNPGNMIPNSVYGLYRMPKTRFFRSRNVDAEPQLIATAKTDQNGILRFEGVLMNQDYMIKELIAPDGSQRSEHPITITFAMKNGEVVLTSFDDGKGTAKLDEEGNIVWYEPDVIVSFEKVDEKGNPLANATLELLDKDGNVVDTWTTGKEAHVAINLLKAGEQYTLKETKAPAGYTLANDISFIVEEKDLGPNEQFVQKVTMQNTLTNLIVEKHDKDSGNVLEGAQFVIYDTHTMEVMKDYAGNELKWTSKGMDQFVGVPAGDYILKETMAPDGYQLAKDLAFTLTENGVLLVDGKVVDKLVVVDERKVDEVITPTPPVDTGDQTQVNMYLAMLSVSVMALGVLIRKLWTLNRKA